MNYNFIKNNKTWLNPIFMVLVVSYENMFFQNLEVLILIFYEAKGKS